MSSSSFFAMTRVVADRGGGVSTGIQDAQQDAGDRREPAACLISGVVSMILEVSGGRSRLPRHSSAFCKKNESPPPTARHSYHDWFHFMRHAGSAA
jgi:hypothetical protein